MRSIFLLNRGTNNSKNTIFDTTYIPIIGKELNTEAVKRDILNIPSAHNVVQISIISE